MLYEMHSEPLLCIQAPAPPTTLGLVVKDTLNGGPFGEFSHDSAIIIQSSVNFLFGVISARRRG
jgi:hypothetical protein